MCGLLPDPDHALATMGIASTLAALGYMLPLGMADAVVTLVSNELGGGNHHAARYGFVVVRAHVQYANITYIYRNAVGTAVSLAFVAQCAQAGALLLLRGHVGRLWTDDAQVLASLKLVLVPTALSMAGDGVCATIGGALACVVCVAQCMIPIVSIYIECMTQVPCAGPGCSCLAWCATSSPTGWLGRRWLVCWRFAWAGGCGGCGWPCAGRLGCRRWCCWCL